MFELNQQTAQYAKDADLLSGYINESGQYTGHFESAIWHVKNGVNGKSEGIFFHFVSDAKQKARFYINTSYRNGEKNQSGLNLVYAILACLRERSAGTPSDCLIRQYDKDAGQIVDMIKPCFVSLQNKPIGLVIQMIQEDGDDYPKPSILAPFEASSGFTASEILNSSKDKTVLDKLLKHIEDKPLYDKRTNKFNSSATPPAPPAAQSPYQTTQQTPATDDIDDDIPF